MARSRPIHDQGSLGGAAYDPLSVKTERQALDLKPSQACRVDFLGRFRIEDLERGQRPGLSSRGEQAAIIIQGETRRARHVHRALRASILEFQYLYFPIVSDREESAAV